MKLYAKSGVTIHIGRAGENYATEVYFDITNWVNDFPNGKPTLIVQQNGFTYMQTSHVEYGPKTSDGKFSSVYVIWDTTNSNNTVAGMGKCQLFYFQKDSSVSNGERIVKSAIYDIIVTNSLGDGEDEPPAAYKSWVDDIVSKANYVVDNIDKALEAATNAKSSADNAAASAKAAKDSETNAKISEFGAKASQDAAKESEINAKNSEIDARDSKIEAKNSEINAEKFKISAKNYEINAARSADEAKNYLEQLESKSWLPMDGSKEAIVDVKSLHIWTGGSDQITFEYPYGSNCIMVKGDDLLLCRPPEQDTKTVLLRGLALPFSENDAANKKYVDDKFSQIPSGKSAYQYAVDGGYTGTEEEFQALMGSGPWLPISGGQLNGSLTVRNGDIVLQDYNHSLSLEYSADADGGVPFLFLNQRVSGSVGNLIQLIGLADPLYDDSAATKKYVDNLVGNIASLLDEINGVVI